MNDNQPRVLMRTYCKLFVHSALPHYDVVSMITRVVGGIRQRYYIGSTSLEICVQDNDDYHENLATLNEDGFLYYRYFLDIEPSEGVARSDYITSIGNLLESLWNEGFKAIAACDFENELPRNGGYKYSSAG